MQGIQPSREALAEVGKAYQLHLARFNEFVDALQALPQHIPSLSFGARTPSQIEFSFLGVQQCLRHDFRNVDGKWVSTITRLIKETPDSKEYAASHMLGLDHNGNLEVSKGQWPWSVLNDSEFAFYFLMTGN